MYVLCCSVAHFLIYLIFYVQLCPYFIIPKYLLTTIVDLLTTKYVLNQISNNILILCDRNQDTSTIFFIACYTKCNYFVLHSTHMIELLSTSSDRETDQHAFKLIFGGGILFYFTTLLTCCKVICCLFTLDILLHVIFKGLTCRRCSAQSPCIPVSENGYLQPEWRSNYESDYSYDSHNPRPLCSRDLLSWAFQIARGMEYLASRKVMRHFHYFISYYIIFHKDLDIKSNWSRLALAFLTVLTFYMRQLPNTYDHLSKSI